MSVARICKQIFRLLCVNLPDSHSCLFQFWLVVHTTWVAVFGESWQDYSYYAYSKPYTRVPAHLVGMAFGFVNERWVSEPAMRPNLNRAAVKTWGAAAVTALFACVLAPLSDYRDPESWSSWVNAIFTTLCRPVWAAGLGIIATLCAAGQLGSQRVLATRLDTARQAHVWRVSDAPSRHQMVRWHRDDSYHFGWRYDGSRAVQLGVFFPVRSYCVAFGGAAGDVSNEERHEGTQARVIRDDGIRAI